MYKPTKDDRSNPFFKRYFMWKRLHRLSWAVAIASTVLLYILTFTVPNLITIDISGIYVLVMVVCLSAGIFGYFGQDKLCDDYKESKFGSIYNSTTIEGHQEEVDNTVESRSQYVKDYRTYLMDELTKHRDRIAKSSNLGRNVYITYPVKSEVGKLNRSWDFTPSSSGKSVAFANPYTFKESLIKLAFKNQDGTYDIKVIESWSGLLNYQGTALELPGYALPVSD